MNTGIVSEDAQPRNDETTTSFARLLNSSLQGTFAIRHCEARSSKGIPLGQSPFYETT